MNAMSSLETRNVARDSLFLFAEVAFDGQPGKMRVKVRNLSAGGMMVDSGELAVSRGDRLTVNLRNVGQVKGRVAWAQGSRFGVAFDTQIDPKRAREPVTKGPQAPAYTRPALAPNMFTHHEKRIRNL